MIIHIVALPLVLALQGPAQASQGGIDLNGDESIDGRDLTFLLERWKQGGSAGKASPADLDGSGWVDERDLEILLRSLGTGSTLPAVAGQTHLAGNRLTQYPFFEYVRAFNQGTSVYVAIDPTRFPSIVGETCRVYLVNSKTPAQWAADPTLTDVTQDGFQVESFPGGTIQANTFLIQGMHAVSGTAGTRVGVGYDVILDCNQNGVLDGADFIDGLTHEPGLYIVRNTAAAGPYGIVELNYDIPNWTASPPAGWGGPAGYQNENIFYPADIGSLGQVPMIVVSRGNGHNHNWYDHLGNHMASYGYVLMSHNNQTEPSPAAMGVETAATTSLLHTDAFIANLPLIDGGLMNGHVDINRIVWIGHSRGGEGVTIAYDRLFDGTAAPLNYSIDDIQLISTIAPTAVKEPTINNPHDVNFHVWTGGADSDISGCAIWDWAQSLHLHDRAEQYRQSISLYGVGHGDFHNGPGSSYAFGPCLVGRPRTHQIMKGYLLPLVKRYLEGDIPSKDFLTRPWERFKPIGAPTTMSCLPPDGTGVDVVANLMYRDGAAAANFMIDDFQTQLALNISSSGGTVTMVNLTQISEDRADDQIADTGFTWTESDLMNSVTLGRSDDSTRALIFTWNGPASIAWEIVPQQESFLDDVYLSFRAAQPSRHPNTLLPLADQTFAVTLVDADQDESTINIAAYAAGLEEPYQRQIVLYFSSGTPLYCAQDDKHFGTDLSYGWNAEFEVVRIRLTDFLNNGSDVDLGHIAQVRFDFGGSGSSAVGRVCIDEIEITKD